MHDNPPILVCADLQTEYLTEGRSHVISDAEAIMSICLRLMTYWRDNLWPVMHLKRIAQAAWFNPASNLTNWITEFKPQPGELSFEHPLPSAYSSTRFAEDLRTAPTAILSHDVVETSSRHQILVGRVEIVLLGASQSRFGVGEFRGGGVSLRGSCFDQSIVFPRLRDGRLGKVDRPVGGRDPDDEDQRLDQHHVGEERDQQAIVDVALWGDARARHTEDRRRP